MGAAVEVFEGATAIGVGRDRFLPVKTTNDLLLLRSDVYEVDDAGHLVRVADRGVLDAAGVSPDYLELRGTDLGDAPEKGDARLLIAVELGGVRLTDNVGLPLGIGFKNIEAEQQD